MRVFRGTAAALLLLLAACNGGGTAKDGSEDGAQECTAHSTIGAADRATLGGLGFAVRLPCVLPAGLEGSRATLGTGEGLEPGDLDFYLVGWQSAEKVLRAVGGDVEREPAGDPDAIETLTIRGIEHRLDPGGGELGLSWTEGGILYGLDGVGLTREAMVDTAESVRALS